MVSNVKRTSNEQQKPWKALVVVILLGSFPGGSKSLLNCDLARSLCAQHEACASVLRIIPRLCGIEKGACSTVTVDKCKAGLKTLQAFPYFRPTCLCREPHLDPKCNEYRTFIFDHPCMYVDKQEFEDLYHVSALPHCDYALDHCQRDEKCSHLIYRFRQACRVRDDQCVMESSDACQEAWSAVRLSPVFGCICPTNASKRMNKCERVFQQIHSNPCIAALKVHGHGFWSGGRANGYRSAVTGIVAPQSAEDPDAFRPSELEDLNPTRKKERDGGATSSSVGGESPLMVDSSRTSAESSVLSSSYVGAVGGSDGQVVAVSTGADANHIPGLRSTCHEAERRCRNNEQCHLALQDMESSCDPHHCTPNACRRSIKKFYERIPQDLAEEVAFCVCSEKDLDCANAMNKMHPPCSLKSHRDITPLCHQVAQDCKTNPHCRPTLESFEQACAVDSDTLRCAGRRGECRSSVIRTLGSQLRVPCSCPPTSMTSPVADVYNCLGWQRLLWLNPCVDEAQDDYLAKRFGLQNLPKPPGGKTVQEVANPYPKQPTEPRQPPSLSTNNYDPRPSPQGQALDDLDDNADYIDRNEDQAPPLSAPGVLSTSSTTKKPTTSTATTTTTTTTSTTTQKPTTVPPRYCELIKGIETYRIMEGSTVRIYNLAKPECSELCECPMQTSSGYRGHQHSAGSNRTPLLGAPKCRALDCVDRQGCYTLSAPYEHGAPAYQAYRGKCICYSGAFICTKPEKSIYVLGEAQGVFLFVGFSRADERILAPLTKKSVLDTIPSLERIIVPESTNKTACRLLLYNSTEENLILQARLMDFSEDILVNGSVPTWFLWRERNECTPALESLKELINRPDPRIRNTPALSMLKLADVEVRMPLMGNTGISTHYATKILVLAVALSFHLFPLVFSSDESSVLLTAKSPEGDVLITDMGQSLIAEMQRPNLVSLRHDNDCTCQIRPS